MSQTLKIAILECDVPIDTVRAEIGSYGDRFSALIRSVLPQCLEGKPQLDVAINKYDATAEDHPALADVHGILITGSKFDSFADIPWILSLVKFIQSAFEARIPIVGICFGHQIFARAMGAPVGRSLGGWETSVSNIDLSEAGLTLFGKKALSLHQMHRDAVQHIPQGFEMLGSSSRCSIQGLWQPNRVITLQAHPEFNDIIISRLLDKRHGDGLFDDTVYKDGIARASLAHDGLEVMATLARFLIENGNTTA